MRIQSICPSDSTRGSNNTVLTHPRWHVFVEFRMLPLYLCLWEIQAVISAESSIR